MKIWTRIVTFTVDRDLEMGIVLYPTKEAAYAAAAKHGGIALPVDSADLKQLFTPQEFSVEGVTQSSPDAILREHCEDSDDCAIFVENSLSVDSLRWNTISAGVCESWRPRRNDSCDGVRARGACVVQSSRRRTRCVRSYRVASSNRRQFVQITLEEKFVALPLPGDGNNM